MLQYIHIHYYDIVSVGLGHTRSLQWSGQYSQTFSKRYHWCSSDSPGGTIPAGSSVAAGSHDGSLRKSMVLSVTPHLHLSGKMVRKVKMLHFLNALQCCFSGVLIKVVTPVESWYNTFTTLRPHQLCHIWSSWGIDSLNYIIKATNVRFSVQLFEQSKTPIRWKFSMPDW